MMLKCCWFIIYIIIIEKPHPNCNYNNDFTTSLQLIFNILYRHNWIYTGCSNIYYCISDSDIISVFSDHSKEDSTIQDIT